MPSVNKAILIGNVGRTPEIKSFGDGGKIANLTLATSERYKTREGDVKEETTWHNVVVGGKAAEFIEKFVETGQMLYVEGRLRTRTWDGSDGEKHYITEVVATNVQSLSFKPKDEGWSSCPMRNGGNAGQSRKPAPAQEMDFSDLPF